MGDAPSARHPGAWRGAATGRTGLDNQVARTYALALATRTAHTSWRCGAAGRRAGPLCVVPSGSLAAHAAAVIGAAPGHQGVETHDCEAGAFGRSPTGLALNKNVIAPSENG